MTNTITHEEKSMVNEGCKKVLSGHFYFKSVWQALGKGEKKSYWISVIRYRPNTVWKDKMKIWTLKLKMANFWKEYNFFSKLKNKSISDEQYEDAKFLLKTLKMRKTGQNI